jgi:pilus assembly protein CpaC
MTATNLSDVRQKRGPAAKWRAAFAGLALAEMLFAGSVATGQVAVPALPPGTTTNTSNLAPKPPPEVVPQKRRGPKTTFETLEAESKANSVTNTKVDGLIDHIYEPETTLTLDPRRSKLIRTKRPVSRFSVTDPGILEVVQFGPTEFELIGGATGETTLTLWFAGDGGEILRYYIRVERADRYEDDERTEYGNLQRKINEMFPNSVIQLIPIADKLIVRGQARDAEEATAIMSVLRGQGTDQGGGQLGPGYAGGYGGGVLSAGVAARPSVDATDLPALNLISLLDVPGERQVMLKVRVAELTRTALREMGSTFIAQHGDFTFASTLGISGAASAVLSTTDVLLALQALSTNSYSKILAEPNLVTLSGQPAYFIAGGEFAVPTVVGVQGVAAATTNFRGFGTQLAFTPTILDKDRIRLRVAPSFSTINTDNSVNGIPGLNSRSVITTVDLREGQWLAIAGLIQEGQAGAKARVPLIGDIPVVDSMFSRKSIKREETELIVLVSPELIHPLEPEQRPLVLPGMEVTEPGDWQFYLFGRWEGNPRCDHRSTVIPNYRRDVWYAKHDAIRDVKMQHSFRESEENFVVGPHGFSQ